MSSGDAGDGIWGGGGALTKKTPFLTPKTTREQQRLQGGGVIGWEGSGFGGIGVRGWNWGVRGGSGRDWGMRGGFVRFMGFVGCEGELGVGLGDAGGGICGICGIGGKSSEVAAQD